MSSRRPHRTRRVLATLVAAGGLAALLPGSAGAAVGSTSVELGGAVARSLRSQGVVIAASKPATRSGSELTLPVSAGVVKATTTVEQRGALVLRKRVGRTTRSVKLTALQVRLGSRRSTVTAKVGRRRVTVFSITVPRRRLAIDGKDGSVRLRGATLRLTRAAARLLRNRLGLSALRPGVIGKLEIAAAVAARPERRSSGGSGGSGGTGGGTSGPGGGGRQPTPPQRCEQNPVVVGQLPPPPEPLARPATAVAVSGAAITWTALDTWIQYINTGEGALVSDGATEGAPRLNGGTTPLVYDFHFAPKAGSWYDPVSGAARLLFSGRVRFLYSTHAIDSSFKDPEVEMTPTGQSRVIFTFTGSDCTDFGDTRAVFSTVSWSAAGETDGGTRLTFAERPQVIAEGGAAVNGGIYPVGLTWGSVTTSFARP